MSNYLSIRGTVAPSNIIQQNEEQLTLFVLKIFSIF